MRELRKSWELSRAIYALEDQALIQLRKDGLAVGLVQYLNAETNYCAGTGVTRFMESGSSFTERMALRHLELESCFEKQL